jgi:GT2 family glycosyltransferase
MNTPLDISVIVCTYTESRLDFLTTVIETLAAQNTLPREIIIVVDHNPALLEQVTGLFPNITTIENRYERGLSGARNSGIAAAASAIIAFVDDDAIVSPDWTEKLYAPYQDANVMGVGGEIQPHWLSERPRWFPAEFNWVVGCSYLGMPKQTQPVRNLIGCNMSFRREVFQAVGNFESALGKIGDSIDICCEETELCIRAKQQWKDKVLLYEPSALVSHQVPGKRVQLSYFRHRCYQEGLSKALVSRFVGSGNGLSNERSYTMRVLPKGVLRGFADLLHGDVTGPLRSGAIVLGLLTTTLGFIVGTVQGITANRDLLNQNLIPADHK